VRHAALAVALALVAGCGVPPSDFGSPDAGACVAYRVPPTQDLSMPARSFATDVMPIFTSRCDTCHGTTNAPSGNLFLGKTASDAAAVYANIVGMPSGEYAEMDFVTASDPTRSFLMHKLDGDQCQYDSECGGGTCNLAMPMSGGALSQDERDAIREWIYQGAANN
jgi:hypothetical protein